MPKRWGVTRGSGAIALAAMLIATACVTPGGAGAGGAVATLGPGGVSITRDSAGIPHIVAASFTALGYGEGYAFAQDNLCTLADDLLTVEGERSAYFGPNAQVVDNVADVSSSNLVSDLYWRYVRASGLVQRWLSTPPPNGPLPQVRQLYDGFAHGYNAYLRSGQLRDPRCSRRSWVRPITATDLWLRLEQVTTASSGEAFFPNVVQAAPPTRGATRPEGATHAAAGLVTLGQYLDGNAATAGSNGIGLGAQDTRAHDGMVLANPHFPWAGPGRFWMAQLTVPGSYDVEGGMLQGVPLIGIGFNRHLSWTHTVSTARRFVIYQLTLVPGDPTSYLVDGKPVTMGQVPVMLRAGGTTVTHTFYTTRWGPVIVVPPYLTWTRTTAYALADPEARGGARAANEYLRMGQASSVQDLFAVEAQYLAVPSFNTVAADDRGTAYYGDVGAIPSVTQSLVDRCMAPGLLPSMAWATYGAAMLDGSRSACLLPDDPGTPAAGIFNASHLPHLFRTDAVENSNDSFWLANPKEPLTGFSRIIGQTDVAQGLRTRQGNRMIAARVAGTDGLGPPKFTLPTLQALWQSDRSFLAQLVLAALVRDCRAHPSAVASDGQTVDLRGACAALAGYDGTGLLDARGGWLFSAWQASFPAGVLWADRFNPAEPLTTPARLDAANPATLRALADAVLSLRAHGLAPDTSFRQVQYTLRGGRRVPIPGCDTGCFNATYTGDGHGTDEANAAPYGEVVLGSSLVMATELSPHGPTAEGILTYSQATDPTSPWYANMTHLYAQGRWVRLAYTPAELAASHPLEALILQADR